jgi:hypothetical protein
MRRFLENQKEIGVNMAVVGFMVEALKFFEDKTADEIKTIAVDIAMQGMHGYNPREEGLPGGYNPRESIFGLSYYGLLLCELGFGHAGIVGTIADAIRSGVQTGSDDVPEKMRMVSGYRSGWLYLCNNTNGLQAVIGLMNG